MKPEGPSACRSMLLDVIASVGVLSGWAPLIRKPSSFRPAIQPEPCGADGEGGRPVFAGADGSMTIAVPPPSCPPLVEAERGIAVGHQPGVAHPEHPAVEAEHEVEQLLG